VLRPLMEQPSALEHLGTAISRQAGRRAAYSHTVATVDETACGLCGACQVVCPTEAITLGETAVKVKAEACCGCGACVEACPNGAISLK
jgi:heterodisulfide reductase subunit A-like polyferredoxin